MRMMPTAAHRTPSLKLTTGPARPFDWKNNPGPGMFEHVSTSVSPALSRALPEKVSFAPAAKLELAHPLPATPGLAMPLPPGPVHGQAATVSPKHSAVPTVPPLICLICMPLNVWKVTHGGLLNAIAIEPPAPMVTVSRACVTPTTYVPANVPPT